MHSLESVYDSALDICLKIRISFHLTNNGEMLSMESADVVAL